MDDRLGHLNGSVQARYDHVTQEMRARLLDELTALWEKASDARIALCPRSPVAALDELLRARARKVNELARDEVRRASQGLA
ncbi:hypothetical protein [Lentzea aerocolonigenes]|uniref:hypothetical protein n=1 Tax=Lentzea aerocolonigenes TaxID=68170 RepID=UPI0007C79A02|nr:hypothetical protein [Lentzea aerocolonigenes]